MFIKTIKLLITAVFYIQFLLNTAFAMDNKELPENGWTCKKIKDLGKGKANHVKCGRDDCPAQIRYVHTMEHENYDRVLKVGSVCAANMDVNAKTREENYKIRENIRKKMRWNAPMLHMPDFHMLINGKTTLIVCKSEDTQYSGQYTYKVDADPSNFYFNTEEEAKQAAIDAKWPLFLKK